VRDVDVMFRLEDRRKENVSMSRILCFCGNDRESGEMACCELCLGWFHFRRMRFKKVDLLEKRDFVCSFCLASITLALLREVDALKEEVKELRGVMKLSERSANALISRTSLKGDEVAGFGGYHWFGHNRSSLSRKAVRGSGGVGILVKEFHLSKLADSDYIGGRHVGEVSASVEWSCNFVAVCYVPPVGSSRDVDVAERLLL